MDSSDAVSIRHLPVLQMHPGRVQRHCSGIANYCFFCSMVMGVSRLQ